MATQQRPPVRLLTTMQLTTVITTLHSLIKDKEAFLEGGSACKRPANVEESINRWYQEELDALAACLALFKQQEGRIFTGL
jgi:hypothetical protein